MALRSLFQSDPVAKADEAFRRGEYQKAADLYLKGGSYEQAADVFAKHLGEIDRAVQVLREAGQPLKAGTLLVGLREHRQAVSLFEEAKAYRQAAEACLSAGLHLRAGRLFEQAGMYRNAAESYSVGGDAEHALDAWERLLKELRSDAKNTSPGQLHEIRETELLCAEILEKLGRLQPAGEKLAACGMHAKAAQLFERGGRWAAAAKAHFDAGQLPAALAALQRSDDADLGLRGEILNAAERYAEAGEVFAQAERFQDAAIAFEHAHVWERAAHLWEHAGVADRAAEIFFRVGRFADAARCFDAGGRHAEAAEAYEAAGDHPAAAAAYEKAGKRLQAGQAYARGKINKSAVKILQEINHDDNEYVAASLELIPLMLERELPEAAEQRLTVLKKSKPEDLGLESPPEMEAEIWYWQGRIDEARGRDEDAERAYQKVMGESSSFRDVGKRVVAIRHRRNAPKPPPPTLPPPPPKASGGVPPAFQDTALAALPYDLTPVDGPWWGETQAYIGTHHKNGQKLHVVSFPETLLGEEADARTFYDKLRKVTRYEHPHLLRLTDFLRAEDRVYLAYEHFEGVQLESRQATRPLQPIEALNVLVQVCDVLIKALKLNLTHGWISPQTILINDANEVRVAGMGLHRVLARHDHRSQAYLAPESAVDNEAGPANDVFGVGLLGLDLLRANLPVGYDIDPTLSPEDVTWPPDVEELLPQVLRRTLVRAQQPLPTERPSVEELKTAIATLGLLPGQLLAERYEILTEIGRGGMGRVYRAKDRQFDEPVAIKTLLQIGGGSSEDQDRLFREVKICRKISHPHVVRVHDFGQFPGGIFIIMELLDGPELEAIIRKEAPLPLARIKTLVSEISSALMEAHRLQVVHRDLKPANVMLVKGRVKVMDFGIACMNDGSSEHLTRAGEVIGSPLYMAPEQIQGLPLAGTCDLYALGVITYALVTGREPFLGETPTAVVFKHLNEPPPDPRQFRPDLPADWSGFLGALLAKKPEQRPQTAEEVIRWVANLSV